MFRWLTVILLSTLAFFPLRSWSTHIVGGEIYYEHVVDDVYEITLLVYRDCFNGIPGFDYPACVSVFDSTNTRIKDLPFYYSTIDTVPIEINDSCTQLVKSVCYEVATYKYIDTLPPIKGGYTFVYDRCCWNGSVINIWNSLETGLTVVGNMPDSVLAYHNSSPAFKFRTPPFLCLNKPFEFDHSAIDADGDSLVYSIFTPFNISKVPVSDACPDPPPYFPLYYTPPYTLGNVMGGTPLTINPITGFLTAVPGVIGQFVFGVKVKEYRNGNYLGETSRNYQFNVEPCQLVTTAAFPNPIESCGDTVISFGNNSSGATSYRWHFGDSNSNDTTSDSGEPTHIYSSTGAYKVRLIAYSYKGDVCNDTTFGNVIIYEEPVGDFSFSEETCINYLQFQDQSSSLSGNITDWYWRFGDGNTSVKQNPFHQFDLTDVPKTYLITLVVTDENNCTDSITKSYTGVNRVYFVEEIGASKILLYPRADSTELYAIAGHSVSYRWKPKTHLSDPNSPNTIAKPPVTTEYTITVTDDRGCEAEKSITIQVHEYTCGESEIYVPNAFTPNIDGENDYLRVRGEEINFLEFNVYNRWGELVFESTDLEMLHYANKGWSGLYKGVLQDPGVFVYYLKVTCNDDHEFIKKGNVTLIR